MDIFRDSQGKPRILSGVSVGAGGARVAEYAGMAGFDFVWIDLEHGTFNFSNVETACAFTKAGGAIPVVRTCSAQRTHILRALEAGGQIVVVPMVNDKTTVEQVVEYGRFPPQGKRGYSTLTRGLHYGDFGSVPFQGANAETHLFVQIETREAVENIDAICSVEGLSGILIGPGDLSTDYGKPAQFDDEEVLTVIEHCIRRAVKAGKVGAAFATSDSIQKKALNAGAQLLVIASDWAGIKAGWQKNLEAFEPVKAHYQSLLKNS